MMVDGQSINAAIERALANLLKSGAAPARIWLDGRRRYLLIEWAGIGRHVQSGAAVYYRGIPVAICMRGDPGERIIDRSGKAHFIG